VHTTNGVTTIIEVALKITIIKAPPLTTKLPRPPASLTSRARATVKPTNIPKQHCIARYRGIDVTCARSIPINEVLTRQFQSARQILDAFPMVCKGASVRSYATQPHQNPIQFSALRTRKVLVRAQILKALRAEGFSTNQIEGPLLKDEVVSLHQTPTCAKGDRFDSHHGLALPAHHGVARRS
jgi:hypothetical protein